VRWSSASTKSGTRLSAASVAGGVPSKGSGSGGYSFPFPIHHPRGRPPGLSSDPPPESVLRSPHPTGRHPACLFAKVETDDKGLRGGARRAPLFRVAVQAESIGQAVSIMKGRHPGCDVRVVFPIDPEGYFLGDRQLRPLQAPSTRN
jgi:hypothetical protein